jgi:hypothetical protein
MDWAKAKGVDVPDIKGAVEIIRSLVHGLISLTMVDRIYGGAPHAKELLRRAMRDMFAAWSAGQKG